ncbi:MAG: beta-ketoacyl-ACP synthase II [Candidatus Dormibacteria bacterium]
MKGYGNGAAVAITGFGAICPVGNDAVTAWQNTVEGKSGVGPLTKFDASAFQVQIAAEVKGFVPEDHFDGPSLKRLAPYCQYSMVAAREALGRAGLDRPFEHPDRVGVVISTGIGGLASIELVKDQVEKEGPRFVSPLAVPMMIPDMAAGYVSIETGALGPNFNIGSACASSAHGIGEAAHIILRGDADVMIAGGVEASITPVSLGGFCAIRALSRRNDSPETASRPFDAERDGFVMAEGAAVLVLERLEHALARGAHVYGLVAGYGATSDAHHVTAPEPDCRGTAEAMRLALQRAGLQPSDIGYINAHGTSTQLNDAAESRAIRKVFGEHADRIPVSSTKGVTGHLMGAGGALEAVFSVMTLEDQLAPPTANLENPDPECDLDYVAGAARKITAHSALSNSFGFGGHNASLVFQAYNPDRDGLSRN